MMARRSSKKSGKLWSAISLLLFIGIIVGFVFGSDEKDGKPKQIADNKSQATLQKAAEPNNLKAEQTEPTARIINYKDTFRRNDSRLVEHLSLIIYFQEPTNLRSPYRVQYDIRDSFGRNYSQLQEYVGANPCKIGYTGEPQILECQRPAYKEIILKSQQQVKPEITKGVVQNGEWWVTKGSEYPTFNSSEYRIVAIKIYDQKSGALLWHIP